MAPAGADMLIVRPYPAAKSFDPALDASFEALRELVRLTRALKAEFGIAPETKVRLALRFEARGAEGSADIAPFLRENGALVGLLVGGPAPEETASRPGGTVALVGKGFEAYAFVKESVDPGRLLEKLRKDLAKDEEYVGRTSAKLANPGFTASAPAEVVAKEREKLDRGRAPRGQVSAIPRGALVTMRGARMSDGAVGMDLDDMLRLKEMHLAPYMQLATALIGNLRRSGGNMFRHQLDTMAILIDYGYIDSVLLKASVIHDLIEDVPGFDRDRILEIDEESADVLKLVLEVTRRPIEVKAEFLSRIREFGSDKARVLKSADRISNMISLGYVTDVEFVRRYTDETESLVFPIAQLADVRMLIELQELVATRREYLARMFEI